MSALTSPAVSPVALPVSIALPSAPALGVPSLAAFIDLMMGETSPQPAARVMTGAERQDGAETGKPLPDEDKPKADPALVWLFGGPAVAVPQPVTLTLPVPLEAPAMQGLQAEAPAAVAAPGADKHMPQRTTQSDVPLQLDAPQRHPLVAAANTASADFPKLSGDIVLPKAPYTPLTSAAPVAPATAPKMPTALIAPASAAKSDIPLPLTVPVTAAQSSEISPVLAAPVTTAVRLDVPFVLAASDATAALRTDAPSVRAISLTAASSIPFAFDAPHVAGSADVPVATPGIPFARGNYLPAAAKPDIPQPLTLTPAAATRPDISPALATEVMAPPHIAAGQSNTPPTLTVSAPVAASSDILSAPATFAAAPRLDTVSVAPNAPTVAVAIPGIPPALTAPVTANTTPNTSVRLAQRRPFVPAAPVSASARATPLPSQSVAALPALFALATGRGAARRDDDAAFVPEPTTALAQTTLTTQIAPTGDTQRQTLHLGRQDWPQKMIDHIEALRDDANANDTSIRLRPEALGRVDVSLKTHVDGAISVRFSADQPTTRTLLADAAPQLAVAAEARGIRLSGTSVDVGGQSDQRPRSDVERPQNISNHLAAPRGDDIEASGDGRIA